MNNNEQRLEVATNRLLLEERRREYDAINDKFHGLRNRILTFLAVEIAVMTYFFADLKSLIPGELYGIVFFVAGASGLVLSVGFFLYCYRNIHNWPVPIGPVEVLRMRHSESESEMLKVAVEDYTNANEEASRIFTRHARLSNWG